MKYDAEEIVEVVKMLNEQDLDIRSVTLSVNTLFAVSDEEEKVLRKLEKINELVSKFVDAVNKVEEKYGIRIVTKRVSVSPAQYFLEVISKEGFGVELAKKLDEIAERNSIDYISGYSAHAERGLSKGAKVLLDSLSSALNSTKRLTGAINAASTMDGVNVEAVKLFVDQIFSMRADASARTSILANSPKDSPFVPSAHHGEGLPDALVNVAISGPGVIESAIRATSPKSFVELYEVIKKASFKITRLGELIGRSVAKQMGVSFGAVDLSVAPSPKVGDSVASIIETMGIERLGGHGSVAALALMMDAVKKGGSMATSSVGGLSSAFIPVSEDSVMAERAIEGSIDFFTLLALSSVCNSGIDMVGVSKRQGKDKVIGLILDVLAMGIMLDKILGVRVIPLDANPGEYVDLGGLLGRVVVMKLKDIDVSKFTRLAGHMPNGIKRLEMG
ncbi:MAG: hypothetical protein ASUL_03824 [Candidatus Aramenus sulfurataquae]|jgi:uncharacterized protein (UPF0210 family)|uniref:DUF711 family protein n=2 Tax=Candidatus Aramenus sulfurataquae TaxID=1326980 RepID=W7KJR4_9CREN|nr:MAG: hypothetical protein ASUL_03824 [Candidatus Aramenus sulfurataquae]MCL7343806.1 DUF711 family protein [Candidatus Aramenus sulfurataquae]